MINRTFRLPTVYTEFPLLVLAKIRPGHWFTVRWRARGAVGFQGDRSVGTLFPLASPCPAVRPASCRLEPPVVCPCFGFDRLSENVIVHTYWRSVYMFESRTPSFSVIGHARRELRIRLSPRMLKLSFGLPICCLLNTPK